MQDEFSRVNYWTVIAYFLNGKDVIIVHKDNLNAQVREFYYSGAVSIKYVRLDAVQTAPLPDESE